ncbi:MAG: peptidoglycan-binding domain-containing protein [Gammaproteobacteria bacterium]
MSTKSTLLTGVFALALGCTPLAFAGTGAGAPESPAAQPASTMQPHKTMMSHSKKSGYRHISMAKMEKIQEALTAKGFTVKADGHWGKNTREALKQFQKKNGLKATGRPNHATLKKLGVTPAK